MEIVLGIAIVGVIALALYAARAKAPKRTGEAALQRETTTGAKRVRLTEQQINVLCAADSNRPIYGENPSRLHSQMPCGAACFNLRTIQSLEKRGFLKSDGKGGYLLTPEGAEGLRSGMGF